MKHLLLAGTVVQVCLGSWITELLFNINEGATTGPTDPGHPLFLTPLIARGDIQAARILSLVGSPFNKKFENSYSGFITTNKTCNSNLFFWFFLSENNPANDPVILYLAGGPGDASTSSVFEGLGPFVVTHFLEDNDNSWNQGNNVLFVDSPVGTGFSFSQSSHCYATTLQDTAHGLHEFLNQFYELFKEYKSNPLFLSGVNYSVKDVLELAFIIHEKTESDLNLTGLILGAPVIDPGEQMDRSDFLYQLGLVDRNDRDALALMADKVKDDLKSKSIKEINPDTFQLHLHNISLLTEGVSNLNYLKDEEEDVPPRSYLQLLQLAETRQALHVGSSEYKHHNGNVRSALRWTLMESVKPQLQYLLEFYDILIYTGQLDATTPYSGVAKLLNSLGWSDSQNYVLANRTAMFVGDEVVSFVKEGGTLTDCMVRQAGHYVHLDKPGYLKEVIRDFTQRFVSG